MTHSRSLVSRKPRFDLWNNTYAFVLHKLGLCCVQAWISICERMWIRVLLHLRQWRPVLSCQRVLVVAEVHMRSQNTDCALQSAAIATKMDISRRCADNERNQMSSQIPRAAVARTAVRVVKAVTTPTSAVAVDKSAIEDLIVLNEMKVAVAVENEDT